MIEFSSRRSLCFVSAIVMVLRSRAMMVIDFVCKQFLPERLHTILLPFVFYLAKAFDIFFWGSNRGETFKPITIRHLNT